MSGGRYRSKQLANANILRGNKLITDEGGLTWQVSPRLLPDANDISFMSTDEKEVLFAGLVLPEMLLGYNYRFWARPLEGSEPPFPNQIVDSILVARRILEMALVCQSYKYFPTLQENMDYARRTTVGQHIAANLSSIASGIIAQAVLISDLMRNDLIHKLRCLASRFEEQFTKTMPIEAEVDLFEPLPVNQLCHTVDILGFEVVEPLATVIRSLVAYVVEDAELHSAAVCRLGVITLANVDRWGRDERFYPRTFSLYYRTVHLQLISIHGTITDQVRLVDLDDARRMGHRLGGRRAAEGSVRGGRRVSRVSRDGVDATPLRATPRVEDASHFRPHRLQHAPRRRVGNNVAAGPRSELRSDATVESIAGGLLNLTNVVLLPKDDMASRDVKVGRIDYSQTAVANGTLGLASSGVLLANAMAAACGMKFAVGRFVYSPETDKSAGQYIGRLSTFPAECDLPDDPRAARWFDKACEGARGEQASLKLHLLALRQTPDIHIAVGSSRDAALRQPGPTEVFLLSTRAHFELFTWTTFTTDDDVAGRNGVPPRLADFGIGRRGVRAARIQRLKLITEYANPAFDIANYVADFEADALRGVDPGDHLGNKLMSAAQGGEYWAEQVERERRRLEEGSVRWAAESADAMRQLDARLALIRAQREQDRLASQIEPEPSPQDASAGSAQASAGRRGEYVAQRVVEEAMARSKATADALADRVDTYQPVRSKTQQDGTEFDERYERNLRAETDFFQAMKPEERWRWIQLPFAEDGKANDVDEFGIHALQAAIHAIEPMFSDINLNSQRGSQIIGTISTAEQVCTVRAQAFLGDLRRINWTPEGHVGTIIARYDRLIQYPDEPPPSGLYALNNHDWLAGIIGELMKREMAVYRAMWGGGDDQNIREELYDFITQTLGEYLAPVGNMVVIEALTALMAPRIARYAMTIPVTGFGFRDGDPFATPVIMDIPGGIRSRMYATIIPGPRLLRGLRTNDYASTDVRIPIATQPVVWYDLIQTYRAENAPTRALTEDDVNRIEGTLGTMALAQAIRLAQAAGVTNQNLFSAFNYKPDNSRYVLTIRQRMLDLLRLHMDRVATSLGCENQSPKFIIDSIALAYKSGTGNFADVYPAVQHAAFVAARWCVNMMEIVDSKGKLTLLSTARQDIRDALTGTIADYLTNEFAFTLINPAFAIEMLLNPAPVGAAAAGQGGDKFTLMPAMVALPTGVVVIRKLEVGSAPSDASESHILVAVNAVTGRVAAAVPTGTFAEYQQPPEPAPSRPLTFTPPTAEARDVEPVGFTDAAQVDSPDARPGRRSEGAAETNGDGPAPAPMSAPRPGDVPSEADVLFANMRDAFVRLMSTANCKFTVPMELAILIRLLQNARKTLLSRVVLERVAFIKIVQDYFDAARGLDTSAFVDYFVGEIGFFVNNNVGPDNLNMYERQLDHVTVDIPSRSRLTPVGPGVQVDREVVLLGIQYTAHNQRGISIDPLQVNGLYTALVILRQTGRELRWPPEQVADPANQFTIPTYSSDVRDLLVAEEFRKAIRGLLQRGKTYAIDRRYEGELLSIYAMMMSELGSLIWLVNSATDRILADLHRVGQTDPDFIFNAREVSANYRIENWVDLPFRPRKLSPSSAKRIHPLWQSRLQRLTGADGSAMLALEHAYADFVRFATCASSHWLTPICLDLHHNRIILFTASDGRRVFFPRLLQANHAGAEWDLDDLAVPDMWTSELRAASHIHRHIQYTPFKTISGDTTNPRSILG